jgi:4-amino-4-deoxy-L-arabinose transferase-like glycosyltransferase
LPEGGPANVQLSLSPHDLDSGPIKAIPDGLGALLSLATPELAVGPVADAPPAPADRIAVSVLGGRRAASEPRPARRRVPARALLPIILAIQAGLSLPLVWSNTAFTDEALYLRSGHLEIEHWLFGTPIPAFPTYFSGSPVIYPPLGALADSVGGLVAARILSLVFMLAASSLLWATASRLCGHRAAFFTTALFAVLGPTLRLGAFATYDAMSLCLIALAAWCAVRASEHERASGWLAAAAVSLAVANAAKYAVALFDPVVIGMLVLLAARAGNWKHAFGRGLTLACYTVGILGFLLVLGGGEYITGIAQTTLTRVGSTSSASLVFGTAWQLTAVVVVTSGLGALLVLFDRRPLALRLLFVLLAGAALLVPLEQARIHTLTSLSKHVAFGAWFAAIAAGYAAEVVIRWARHRLLQGTAIAVCAVLLIPAMRLGETQAKGIFATWPNSTALMAKLRQLLPGTSGPILDDNNRAVAEYYLPKEGDEWYRWSTGSSLRLPDGKSLNVPVGEILTPATYIDRIKEGYFSVVVLTFTSSVVLDHDIEPALAANSHYHLVAEVPFGKRYSQIWEYEPQRVFRSDHLGPLTAKPSSALSSLLMPPARLKPILGTITDVVVFTGIAILLFAILVRLAWRRGKASHEI